MHAARPHVRSSRGRVRAWQIMQRGPSSFVLSLSCVLSFSVAMRATVARPWGPLRGAELGGYRAGGVLTAAGVRPVRPRD